MATADVFEDLIKVSKLLLQSIAHSLEMVQEPLVETGNQLSCNKKESAVSTLENILKEEYPTEMLKQTWFYTQKKQFHNKARDQCCAPRLPKLDIASGPDTNLGLTSLCHSLSYFL